MRVPRTVFENSYFRGRINKFGQLNAREWENYAGVTANESYIIYIKIGIRKKRIGLRGGGDCMLILTDFRYVWHGCLDGDTL
jgi:hypothetical protein